MEEKLEKMEKEMRKNMWNIALALGYMTFVITFMLMAILGIVIPILTVEAAYSAGELIFVSSLIAVFVGFLTYSMARPNAQKDDIRG